MKIAISNLAWEHKQNEEVLKILNKHQIKGIEVAPTKVWKNPTETSEISIKKYKDFWMKNGVGIVATTSLLYGHPELTIFGSKKTRKETLEYLIKIIRLSGFLGAKAMVFGSPKNREIGDLRRQEVTKIACDFFHKIGEIAKKYNIYFGIEPNPPIYGADFILTTKEAIELVKKVNHPNFKVHMDSGTLAENKVDYEKVIKEALPYTCHFHISEPHLKVIPQGIVDHGVIAKALKKLKYNKWLSIEMPLNEVENGLEIIDNVLQFISRTYK